MNALKKIPFFLFLLVLFFCLHGSTENYGFINLKEVAVIGLLMTAGVVLLYAIILFITRDRIFAALISFFIAWWYFFFGPVEDWIKSSSWLFFMQRQSLIIILLLTLTVAWIIYLRRNRSSHTKWTFYLNILLIIYCFIDGSVLLYKFFSFSKKTDQQIAFDYTSVKAKPNVYYLLFDEYPGYQSLKDSFGFSNDSLYDFLEKEKFKVLPIFSNYDYTMFSMSSILNMYYVEPGYDPHKLTQRDFQFRTAEIRNGEVFNIFQKMGYELKNYSIFDIADQHAVSDQNSFLPVHSRMLTDKILHNRLIRTSGWLFETGRFALASLKKDYFFQHQVNNLYSEKMVRQTAAAKKDKPVFCYAHFMLPHGPFYKDSSGNDISFDIIANESWASNKKLFLSYLKYSNTVITSLIKDIAKKDPGAIIIAMSDHGFRSYKNKHPFEPYNFNNICAVRFPDKNDIEPVEKLSNVNFFRYLFNSEYGQHIAFLPDSSIVLSK